MAGTTGSCLCGSVRYSLSAEPMMRVLCHCQNCRKVSGSAFGANGFYDKAAFTITAGQEHIAVYEDSATSTGNTLQRSFCRRCGTPVSTESPMNVDMQGKIAVPSGTLDGVEAEVQWTPQAEFFCKYRSAWLKQGAETAKFQGMT